MCIVLIVLHFEKLIIALCKQIYITYISGEMNWKQNYCISTNQNEIVSLCQFPATPESTFHLTWIHSILWPEDSGKRQGRHRGKTEGRQPSCLCVVPNVHTATNHIIPWMEWNLFRSAQAFQNKCDLGNTHVICSKDVTPRSFWDMWHYRTKSE